jgi:ATP-dependent HslUV protease ATP-binding subunit HslU
LNSLNTDDFIRILTEPANALIKQYTELIKTEDVDIEFSDAAIREIAETASFVNSKAENIGARRLHTIMSKLLEEILFEAPDLKEKQIKIDDKFVRNILKDIVEDEDLRRYIL